MPELAPSRIPSALPPSLQPVIQTVIQTAPPDIYLRPGEMFLARQPSILHTLLGSCVGVTFWCARLGAGALCHAMLPRRPSHGLTPPEHGGRYVDFCIRDLSRQFRQLGAQPGEVQVKLFGGADVLYTAPDATRPTVGRLNCETALLVLREEGHHAIASSLGDTFGRKIRFYTASGDVLLLRLPASGPPSGSGSGSGSASRKP